MKIVIKNKKIMNWNYKLMNCYKQQKIKRKVKKIYIYSFNK